MAALSSFPGPDSAYQDVGEIGQGLGQLPMEHDLTSQDEHRYGTQREGIDAEKHLVRQDNQRFSLGEKGNQRGQSNPKSDGHADNDGQYEYGR